MAHHENKTNLSLDERRFREYMQQGDDFMKIEIFRSAKAWYKKAMDLNMENMKVQEKIDECNRLLNYETKVFTVLGVVATVIIILLIVIN
jgi:hypothetical protein